MPNDHIVELRDRYQQCAKEMEVILSFAPWINFYADDQVYFERMNKGLAKASKAAAELLNAIAAEAA